MNLRRVASRWFSQFKVADLIDWETRSWCVPLLSLMFPPEVVKHIVTIPILGCPKADNLASKLAKDGSFTVKSAYFLALNTSINLLSWEGELMKLSGKDFGLPIFLPSRLCLYGS